MLSREEEEEEEEDEDDMAPKAYETPMAVEGERATRSEVVSQHSGGRQANGRQAGRQVIAP